MNATKKSLGIGIVTALSLAACGGSQPPAPAAPPTTMAVAPAPAPEPAMDTAAMAPEGMLAWENNFDSMDGFYDAAKDKTLGATLMVKDGMGMLTESGKEVWGKTLIIIPGIDFSKGPMLEVVVDKVDGSTWGAGVAPNPWKDAEYKKIVTGEAATGSKTFDLAELTGWTDTREINLALVVEGDNKTVHFDAVRIRYTK
ncbi:MAG: hypothetical protein AAB229_00995 [Candidatus Hydrogenedentota bacterium]